MMLPVIAVASLFAGVGVAVAHFLGNLDQSTYRNLLLAVTAVWFVTATIWAYRKPQN